MRNNLAYILLLLTISFSAQAQSARTLVSNLRCEYLENPLGVDVSNPRFSWMLVDNTLGAKQEAFQILVSTDSLKIAKGIGDSWDSGKVSSDLISTT